jgi:hypothetical protein
VKQVNKDSLATSIDEALRFDAESTYPHVSPISQIDFWAEMQFASKVTNNPTFEAKPAAVEIGFIIPRTSRQR